MIDNISQEQMILDVALNARSSTNHLIGSNLNQQKTWLNSLDQSKGEIIESFVEGSPAQPDVLIVIPVKNRHKHLEKLLNCLVPQVHELFANVSIIVSEMSETAEHKELCEKNAVNYIFHKSSVFNKSCAMNQAYARYPGIPKTLLFHDVDIVMDNGWVKDVLANAKSLLKNKGHTWICQTIKERKVEYVTKENTDVLFTDHKPLSELPSMEHEVNRFWFEGKYPPGGSIMVPVELFQAVGGYDSHLYWGYSPEDLAFIQNCRLVGAITEIDVLQTDARSYHLYHPITEKSNLTYEYMVFAGKIIAGDIALTLSSIIMKSNVALIGRTADKALQYGYSMREAMKFSPCFRFDNQQQFFIQQNSWTHPDKGLISVLETENRNILRIIFLLNNGSFFSSIFPSLEKVIEGLNTQPARS